MFYIHLFRLFLERHHLLSIFLFISGGCGGAIIGSAIGLWIIWKVIKKMDREGLTRFPKKPIKYLMNRK